MKHLRMRNAQLIINAHNIQNSLDDVRCKLTLKVPLDK